MIDIIMKTFKHCPIIYKYLSLIYRKIFAPIISGHMQYYIRYYFTVRRSEIRKLKNTGFKSIRSCKYNEWRIGKGKDLAYRRYYLAQFEEQKCFIKIGTNDSTVKNECLVLENYKNHSFRFSPQYIKGNLAFDNDTVMIAVSYIEGLSKFEMPKTLSEFEGICSQFIEILNVLEDADLVHADIHKGNLTLKNQKLYLMDYGISIIKSKGNEVDYISRPGTFYKLIENTRIYDDAYSFVSMIEQEKNHHAFEDCVSYKKIKEKIGNNVFIVKCKENIEGR